MHLSSLLPSVHAAHRSNPPSIAYKAQATRRAPPLDPDTASAWVYGYYAPWAGDLEDLQWQHLTHVAIFAVDLNADGSLEDEVLWTDLAPTAMELAAPHGVHVHLTLTCFDDQVMTSVLVNPTTRATAVSNLGALVDAQGAHGVSVDCEGMPSSLKPHLVSFVGELKERVGEVTVATPAVDWSGAYDYDALAANSDGLFIMGYGYHWSGSSESGPTDPLYAGDGTVWSSPWSLSWTLDDYLAKGADPARVIVGLPLYGYAYQTSSTDVPTPNLGSNGAVFMGAANLDAAVWGAEYEETSASPYFDGLGEQVWYPTVDSVEERVIYAVDHGMGIGFWALHYDDDDPLLWERVQAHTTPAGTADPTESTPSTSSTHSDPLATVEPRVDPAAGKGGGCSTSGYYGWVSWMVLLPLLARRHR